MSLLAAQKGTPSSSMVNNQKVMFRIRKLDTGVRDDNAGPCQC